MIFKTSIKELFPSHDQVNNAHRLIKGGDLYRTNMKIRKRIIENQFLDRSFEYQRIILSGDIEAFVKYWDEMGRDFSVVIWERIEDDKWVIPNALYCIAIRDAHAFVIYQSDYNRCKDHVLMKRLTETEVKPRVFEMTKSPEYNKNGKEKKWESNWVFDIETARKEVSHGVYEMVPYLLILKRIDNGMNPKHLKDLKKCYHFIGLDC